MVHGYMLGLQHLLLCPHCLGEMPSLNPFCFVADEAEGTKNDAAGTGFLPSASDIFHMVGVHHIFLYAACSCRKPSGDGKDVVGESWLVVP